MKATRERCCMVLLLLSTVACQSDVAGTEPTDAPAGGKADDTDQGASGAVLLDQGWDEATRRGWYHRSEGSRILPYSWVVAVELPFDDVRLLEPSVVRSYGITPDSNVDGNPGAMPIGFAMGGEPGLAADEDGTLKETASFGYNCALCHNTEVRFDDQWIRVEGGAGNLDFAGFNELLVKSLLRASLSFNGLSSKSRRFIDRVQTFQDQEYGRHQSSDEINDELDSFRSRVFPKLIDTAITGLAPWRENLLPTEEGPGRSDAIGRGANILLGELTGIEDNLSPADAPNSLAPLYDVDKWDWFHYPSWLRQPLARDVGQALGVRAGINIDPDAGTMFSTGVDLEGVMWLEDAMGTLKPPTWPEELFGAIDAELQSEGEGLYNQHCGGCHNLEGGRLGLTALEDVGTDPNTAVNFSSRQAHLEEPLASALGFEAGVRMPITAPLAALTSAALEQTIVDAEERGDTAIAAEARRRVAERDNVWRGEAPVETTDDDGNVVEVTTLVYRARPLDGMWIAGPFLHNNSVPTIRHLLGPESDRPDKFFAGSPEFLPDELGFEWRDEEDHAGNELFEFDIRESGNSNEGHVFSAAYEPTVGARAGVVGPALTDHEIDALIEYMKTMRLL